MSDPMNDVTRILSAIEQGDPQAAEELLPLVYDELRRLAGRGWPRRSRGRRSRPRPWSTRPTSGWSMARRPSGGTAAATSSPRRPRRCAASSSRTPAASGPRSTAAGCERLDLDDVDIAAPAPSEDLLALDEALDEARSRGPGQGRARQAPLLRRADRGGGRERPRDLPHNGPTLLALRQGLAPRRAAGSRGARRKSLKSGRPLELSGPRFLALPYRGDSAATGA